MVQTTIFLSQTIVISFDIVSSLTHISRKLCYTQNSQLFSHRSFSSLHLNHIPRPIIQQHTLFHFRLSFMKLSSSRKFSQFLLRSFDSPLWFIRVLSQFHLLSISVPTTDNWVLWYSYQFLLAFNLSRSYPALIHSHLKFTFLLTLLPPREVTLTTAHNYLFPHYTHINQDSYALNR